MFLCGVNKRDMLNKYSICHVESKKYVQQTDASFGAFQVGESNLALYGRSCEFSRSNCHMWTKTCQPVLSWEASQFDTLEKGYKRKRVGWGPSIKMHTRSGERKGNPSGASESTKH